MRQLLTHSGGSRGGRRSTRSSQGKAAYLERIVAMDLAYEPGTKAVYSDLGIILLGDVVERLAGRAARRAGARARARAARDEGHALPSARRRSCRASRRPRTTPGAAACCAARCTTRTRSRSAGSRRTPGLFGTAPDLARFARDAARRGRADGRRLVSRATLELFTRARRRAAAPRARSAGTRRPTSRAGAARLPASPATRRPARSVSRARSATPASPARRSGWTRERGALRRSCSRTACTRRARTTRSAAVRAEVADAAVRALADA